MKKISPNHQDNQNFKVGGVCTSNILAIHAVCKPIINTEHALQIPYKWQLCIPCTVDTLSQMSANVYRYKVKEPSLPYYLPISDRRIVFSRLLVLYKMQTALSRFWTWLAMFSSYNDNYYTSAFIYCDCKLVYNKIKHYSKNKYLTSFNVYELITYCWTDICGINIAGNSPPHPPPPQNKILSIIIHYPFNIFFLGEKFIKFQIDINLHSLNKLVILKQDVVCYHLLHISCKILMILKELSL